MDYWWTILLLSAILSSVFTNDFTKRTTNPVIIDYETGQTFPISDFSLREDPPLLLPPPNPEEFPPEYLESLLKHCDDPIPGVWEFLVKSWIGLKEFGLNWKRYPASRRVLYRILRAIRPVQILHAFLVAVCLSWTRFLLQTCLLNHLSVRLGLPVKTTRRLLESGWKAFWFCILWLCSFYTIILSGRTDFHYPLRIFQNVQMRIGYFDIPTPTDYYLLYTLQIGFYLHSVWSVLFADTWRKDSGVLCVHHCLTLLLLQFSLVLRLHRIGALVVFLHDVNDVFLELAKLHVYLQARHEKFHTVLANAYFFIFTASWIVTRLYWFPLKVLYATSWGMYITNVGREYRSFLFFNLMLWALFFMHIYWFRFIFLMLVRLIICPTSGDMREDDDVVPADNVYSLRDENSNTSSCTLNNDYWMATSVKSTNGMNTCFPTTKEQCISNGFVGVMRHN